jgi:GntR family transcriptional regulator
VTVAPHIRVANELRTRIQAGALRRGDLVPSRAELAAEFAVSGRAIQDALGTLRAEGLIGGRSGEPWRVQRELLNQDFDALSTFTAWVRSLGREPGARTIEIAMRGADQLVAEELGLPLRSAVLYYKRLRTVDGQPVMIERSNYPQEIGQILRGCDLDRESTTEKLAERGIEFASALHRIEAVPALARDAELLEIPRRSPLLQIRRRSFDPGGTPIEFGIDRYRGDVFAFVMHSGAQ